MVILINNFQAIYYLGKSVWYFMQRAQNSQGKKARWLLWMVKSLVTIIIIRAFAVNGNIFLGYLCLNSIQNPITNNGQIVSLLPWLLWILFFSFAFQRILSFTKNCLNLHKFSINAVFRWWIKFQTFCKLLLVRHICCCYHWDYCQVLLLVLLLFQWQTVVSIIDWYKWLFVFLFFPSLGVS